MGRRGLNVVVWGSAFALGVRCLLFAWEGLPELLSTRIELVTPVTSYNRRSCPPPTNQIKSKFATCTVYFLMHLFLFVGLIFLFFLIVIFIY
jgi:hypothetical protein